MIIYAPHTAFHKRLAILTIREHLCGYYQLYTKCADSLTVVDSDTGHTVCLGCDRITVSSGLRACDMCEREYIDKTKYQTNDYDTYCPECVIKHDLYF